MVVCPNGARILDQLGIADDIFSMAKPLANALTGTALVINSNAPILTAKRSLSSTNLEVKYVDGMLERGTPSHLCDVVTC